MDCTWLLIIAGMEPLTVLALSVGFAAAVWGVVTLLISP